MAATGGHLEQLYRFHRRLAPLSGEVEWATHDDPQSRSLLAGEKVHFIPYVPPRGWRQLAKSQSPAWAILRKGRFDRVISTGAGVAIPFMVAARATGVECHYIESAARADGPSLTGRVMARLPGVRLYSQYPSWADDRWSYRGSLFDTFRVEPIRSPPIRSVVVTLGTMRSYSFRRAVDRLRFILPEVLTPEATVLWQVGATDASGLAGDVRANLPNAELREAIGAADLVVAHAGIGSALCALELGRRPVLVPRRSAFDEHVDDHQTLISRELDERGLAVSREADQLTAEDLVLASSARIGVNHDLEPFPLSH